MFQPQTANIILYCRRWAQTVYFYRKLLSFPVLFETDWFVEFSINDLSRLSIADETRSTIKSSQGDGLALALEVEDIEATRTDMKAVGLEPTAIRNHPWNARVFYLFDPEGRRIEIWQKQQV